MQTQKIDKQVDELQMDLFSPEVVIAAEGYAALERLDLKRAQTLFRNVLDRAEGHPAASFGLQLAALWDELMAEASSLEADEAALFLWRHVTSSSFGTGGEGLRRAVIRQVIALVENDLYFSRPPDLCLGSLLFELGEYRGAEKAFRRLYERHQDDMRLLLRIADCVFLQERPAEARVLYARALLAGPEEIPSANIRDAAVSAIVSEKGVLLAPVFGWVRGVLPLVDADDIRPATPEHAGALATYCTLARAEAARRKGDHQEMVEQRRLLKASAPDVFEEYIDLRIRGAGRELFPS